MCGRRCCVSLLRPDGLRAATAGLSPSLGPTSQTVSLSLSLSIATVFINSISIITVYDMRQNMMSSIKKKVFSILLLC